MNEINKKYFTDIVQKIIGDRNYCLWLCKERRDIYDSYVGVMPENHITYEEYLECISEYEIPEDYVLLSDLGKEGALYVYKVS